MATATELTFFNAVRLAEGVRQVARASAFATYGYVQANLAAYLTALEAADNTYMTAVATAANTLATAGYTIPNAGTPNPGNVNPGGVGFSVVSGLRDLGNGHATMGALG